MDKRILALSIAILLCLGCAQTSHYEEILYEDGKLKKYAYVDDTKGGKGDSSVFLDAVEIIKRQDSTAFPDPQDLPLPQYNLKKWARTRSYTGLIKNYSRHEVSIPSANSSAAVVVPARDWREYSAIEYTVWSPAVNLQGFVDGQVVYQQKLVAQPKKFQYMGKYYDFVAEIKPPQPEPKAKPKYKKKRKVKSQGKC